MRSGLIRTCSGPAMAVALMAVNPAVAQTAPAPATASSTASAAESGEGAESGELVVVGIRNSLRLANDVKRSSPQILDVISADDIGKLPDQNVAEALQRVTGVQITRVFGEGQSVSIRGLQQVRVEVDNRTLLAFSARLSPPENEQLGRSSGLDSVASSAFGRIEVQKSALASQVEGGLGGTVNLVTPRPFDFKKTTVSLRAGGTVGDMTNKLEPNLNGLVTTKFADGRIGVLLSAEYQKRTLTMQTFERNNFFNRQNGTTSVFQAPQLLQYEQFVVDRTRTSVNGSVQFQATPDLVFTAESLYSKLNTGRKQDFLAWRLPNSPTAAIITNPVVVDNAIVAGTANGTLTTAGQLRDEPTESVLVGFNGKYDDGTLSIAGDTSYSRGTIEQTIQIITLQAKAAVPGSFDFRGGPIPSLSLGTAAAPFNAADFNNYNPASNGVRSNLLRGVLEEYVAKIDVGYRFGDSIRLDGGLRFAKLEARSNAFRSQVTPTRDEIVPFLKPIAGSNFLPDIVGNIPRDFLSTAPTLDYVFNRAQAAQPNPAVPGGLLPNAARDYDLRENTFAGYLMLSAETEILGMPTKANAGVRVIATDFSVDTLQQSGTTAAPIFTPVNDTSNYTNVLPSANVTFTATPDFLIRVAASKTMQRAGIAELAPSIFVNITNRTASGGNAQLKPPTAFNLDASFEYYTGPSSLISGALFYKDVRNFIASNTTLETFPGFETLGPIPYTRPDNVASAKVKGFEIGVTQFLDFLPAPLDGLGVIANYTFADASDSAGFDLVATSRHSYNLIGLYEKGPFSARVAYNHRSRAVFEFTEGRPSYIAARSQLDVQLGVDVTKTIALQFQAQNLLPSDSATVEFSGNNPVVMNSYALAERRFLFGARARF